MPLLRTSKTNAALITRSRFFSLDFSSDFWTRRACFAWHLEALSRSEHCCSRLSNISVSKLWDRGMLVEWRGRIVGLMLDFCKQKRLQTLTQVSLSLVHFLPLQIRFTPSRGDPNTSQRNYLNKSYQFGFTLKKYIGITIMGCECTRG